MVNIPENPYSRILSPAETAELVKDGWRQNNTHMCQECFARGCEHCHQTGVIGYFSKNDKWVFGAPKFEANDSVGAVCRVDYHGLWDKRVHFRADGCGGSAKLIFSIPQMFSMLKMFANVCDNMDGNHGAEFGIEAKFRGPPAMALSALSKDRMIVACIPNENQTKALNLLKDAGLLDEAKLLASAFEHEIFRGDEKKNRETREAVGKIEPGTIFSRKKGHAVVEDMAVEIDSDQSLLSQLK